MIRGRAATPSVALALAVSVAAPLTAVAQYAPAVDVDRAVQARVGSAWGVEPDDVVLEWGAAPAGAELPSEPVTVVGSGTGGHFVVRLGRADDVVSVRVRAGTVVRRPVAARAVRRGTVLEGDDVRFDDRLLWGRPEPPRASPVGWVAHRTLAAGAVLEAPAVRVPLAVTSGSTVELVWAGNGVRVSVRGTAAGSGAVGDRVRVRTRAGARMTGVIVAPGTVDVSPGADISLRGEYR